MSPVYVPPGDETFEVTPAASFGCMRVGASGGVREWISTMVGLLTAVGLVCGAIGLSSDPHGIALVRTWLALGCAAGLAILGHRLDRQGARSNRTPSR